LSNFSQKILIIVAAISIVLGGIWYLQREWILQDPAKVTVDPRLEREVHALLEESINADFQKRMTLFFELRSRGREIVPVLVRALNDEHEDVRAFSANLLQYSENAAVIPYLEARLHDESPRVRKTALIALGDLGAIDAVPAIILVLNDEDQLTRCQAAYVLGVLKNETAVTYLVRTLEHDPYPIARQTAANSLGEIGDAEAVPPLIDSLDDTNHLVRSASMVALNRITGVNMGPTKEAWAGWWNKTKGL